MAMDLHMPFANIEIGGFLWWIYLPQEYFCAAHRHVLKSSISGLPQAYLLKLEQSANQ